MQAINRARQTHSDMQTYEPPTRYELTIMLSSILDTSRARKESKLGRKFLKQAS